MERKTDLSRELWNFFALTLGLTYLVFWGPDFIYRESIGNHLLVTKSLSAGVG